MSDAILTDSSTISEAKAWLNARLNDGATCPCCTQFAKLYHRPFNSGMARCLIWLVRFITEVKQDPKYHGYVHVPTTAPRHVIRNREFDKLELHGVAETCQSDDPTMRTSGLWRPTAHGIAVVRAGAQVAKSIDVYNGQIISRSGAMIGIREALGIRFDYEEMMKVQVTNILAGPVDGASNHG